MLWFVEEGMSLTFKGDHWAQFLSILKNEGCKIETYHRNLWDSPVDFNILNPNEPTILYCSINDGKRYWEESNQNTNLPKPGVWFDSELLRCSSYFNMIGEYLLNRNYGFLKFDDLFNFSNEVFHKFNNSKEDKIFIRPERNEKNKLFVGEAFDLVGFKSWLSYNHGYVDPNTICVVAPGKKISNEWRLIVDQNRKVVSGSLYKTNGELLYQNGFPKKVKEFAEEVASVWSPHPVWCLDVGESEGELGVVELSTVNCSGWYDSEIEPIVKTINEAVLNPV